MKKYTFKNIFAIALMSCFIGVSCNDVQQDEITEIHLDRVLTPTGIAATITKVVDLTLKWNAVGNAQGYEVEIYTDSLKFEPANKVYTGEVATTTFKYTLLGDKQYSARIRSISTKEPDSKWTGVAFETDINSVFLNQVLGDVSSEELIFHFPPGTVATHIILTSTGTPVNQAVTATDITNGLVKVIELTPSTKYTAILYNDTQRIGKAERTTLAAGTKVVNPTDDLLAIIAAADEGASLQLMPGEYLAAGEIVPITKSITISGADINNRPTVHAQFELNLLSSFTMKDVILDGKKADATNLEHAFRFIGATGAYGKILIEGSVIQNYGKSLIACETVMKSSIEEITLNNCIVTNILTNSADGIDVRAGLIQKLNLTKCTFNNVAPARDFIRMDNSTAFPGKVPVILIDKCTFYKVSNDATKRILYVRFAGNTSTISNSIFTETDGSFANQAATAKPTFLNNNYFNTKNLLPGSTVLNVKVDDSSSKTTDNPQFEAPATGNFKVKNANVTVGDPRWLP